MVIFHSYVSLPEGKTNKYTHKTTWLDVKPPSHVFSIYIYIYIIYTYSRYCCSHAHDWTGFQKIGFHSQGWPIFRQDLCPGFVLNDPPQTPWFSRGFTHIYVCLQMWLCVHMYNMYVYNMYIYIYVYVHAYIYIYIILYIILRTIEEVFYLTGKKQKISFMLSHR